MAELSLREEMKTARIEITSLKKKMVSLAEDVQATEQEMQQLEEHTNRLVAEKDKLEETLQADKRKTARLSLALQRLSRVPPEALIAQPSAPLYKIRSGILIQSAIPPVMEEARHLRESLDQLDNVTQQLVEDRKQLLRTRQKLAVKQVQMRTYLKHRENYITQTDEQRTALNVEIKRIAAQADTLQDLVDKVRNSKLAEATFSPPLPPPSSSILSSLRGDRPTPHKKTEMVKLAAPTLTKNPQDFGASPRLPASGIIETGYGDKDLYGAQSRGLKIRTREESLVVAPIAGEIRFAGEFGRFGRVLIIEHKNNYHSLIAGLAYIDVQAGTHVVTGEPVGRMGPTYGAEKPILYYELRKKGQPVDPSVKFGSLS